MSAHLGAYTRDELMRLPVGALPTRGLQCPKCGAIVPQFADLTDQEEARLRRMICEGRKTMATYEIRSLTLCPLSWGKIWVLHSGRADAVGTTAPCPYCGEPSQNPGYKNGWFHRSMFEGRDQLLKPVRVVFDYRFSARSPALAFVALVALVDYSRGDVRTSCDPFPGGKWAVTLEMVPTDLNITAFARFLGSRTGSRHPPRWLDLCYTFPKSCQARAFVKDIMVAYPDGNVRASCNPLGVDWQVKVRREMLPTGWHIMEFDRWFLDFELYLSPYAEFCLLHRRPRPRPASSLRRLPGSFGSAFR